MTGRSPDFLGIGATRGGSSWLYRALSRHPDIWLPPVKEIHYFDRPRDGTRTISFARRELLVRARDYLNRERTRSTGDSLWQTVCWDWHYLMRPRSVDWYRGLLRPREGQITGEVTPAYAILDESRIRWIDRINPRIKALYMLRNPIDRAWSSIVNSLARKHRRNIADVPLKEILRKADSIARPRGRSDYAGNIRAWRSVIGEHRLFIGYMEEIRSEPEQLMERICGFLGVAMPDRRVRQAITERVNTTTRYSAPMPDQVRHRLATVLLPLIEDMQGLLGEYAQNWLTEARRN